MRYAIVTGGAVTNVIVLRETNAGDFPGAVALHDRPVGIGDTYSESKFWRDGEDMPYLFVKSSVALNLS